MRKILLLLLLMQMAMSVMAESWNEIRESGRFYYGIGVGNTEEEAKSNAITDMLNMIATHAKSEFGGIEEENATSNVQNHQSHVLNCIKTYSGSIIQEVETFSSTKTADGMQVRVYMQRSVMEKVYEERVAKAKNMISIAEESLKARKIDMALQYYYWAYSLIRSTQNPEKIKNEKGTLLVNAIPLKIREILSNITVKYEGKDEDYVDLQFFYNGQPVSSIEFTYNDGRTMCDGAAKDGRGMIEMIPGYDLNVYNINIEYEFKNQVHGDNEMEAVMNVLARRPIQSSEVVVMVNGASSSARLTPKNEGATTPNKKNSNAKESQNTIAANNGNAEDTGIRLNPSASQVATNQDEYAEIMTQIVKAIQSRNYSNADRYFTLDGLDRYKRLIKYGTGRIVGNPEIVFFNSTNDNVVARGLQMSFSFKTGRKRTFVEDVVFTFNADKKIDNVTFGLGQVAANDILCGHEAWGDETREMMMEFMENYKTAYNLKDSNYIKAVFADDAIIIVGKVVKKNITIKDATGERKMSASGQQLVTYNRYTKEQYIRNLCKSMRKNEFINIRFGRNDIQRINEYEFGIQISQEYNSSSYADQGFLFLLVNMKDSENPLIKIRTWQPNEVDMNKLYSAGDFFDK